MTLHVLILSIIQNEGIPLKRVEGRGREILEKKKKKYK